MNLSRNLSRWIGGLLGEYVDNVDAELLQVWQRRKHLCEMLNKHAWRAVSGSAVKVNQSAVLLCIRSALGKDRF